MLPVFHSHRILATYLLVLTFLIEVENWHSTYFYSEFEKTNVPLKKAHFSNLQMVHQVLKMVTNYKELQDFAYRLLESRTSSNTASLLGVSRNCSTYRLLVTSLLSWSEVFGLTCHALPFSLRPRTTTQRLVSKVRVGLFIALYFEKGVSFPNLRHSF